MHRRGCPSAGQFDSRNKPYLAGFTRVSDRLISRRGVVVSQRKLLNASRFRTPQQLHRRQGAIGCERMSVEVDDHNY